MNWFHLKARNGRWMTHRGVFLDASYSVRRRFQAACGKVYQTIDAEGPISPGESLSQRCRQCTQAEAEDSP